MSTHENEQAPLFKRWWGWYWLLIIVLLGLIGVFYYFTKHFA